jgi:hypothetical protein
LEVCALVWLHIGPRAATTRTLSVRLVDVISAVATTQDTAGRENWRRTRRANEQRLFARLAVDRSPAAREAIVEQFMPLARQLARRYRNVEDVEDLEQVAAIGLVKAYRSLRPGAGAGVLVVCVSDHPGRAQAPSARPRLVRPTRRARSRSSPRASTAERTRFCQSSGVPRP